MANWQLNRFIKERQIRAFLAAGTVLILLLALFIALLADGRPKKPAKKAYDLTGIVDESFTDAIADSALTAQQTELESLKKQVSELSSNIKTMAEAHARQLELQKDEFKSQFSAIAEVSQNKTSTAGIQSTPPELKGVQNPELWHNPNTYAMNGDALPPARLSHAKPQIHTVSFRPKRRKVNNPYNYLNPNHFVPANTSVRAVVLGGADSDASVNGQSKNNGVMLFKFLEDGKLPNGQRARLQGCRVSANTYGDISSERAYGTLYKLSCAYPGKPIIEKKVNGWVFYKGKVGIKGVPVMKDGKVLKWAGFSGALSGIASAAQYAQSVQSIGTFGAASVVPSGKIGPFAAYGGASKAADTLSQYYIKRAEQYHPVIPVGAGNEVTVVFEDGFYLEPDEEANQHAPNRHKVSVNSEPLIQSDEEEASGIDMNFTVPPEVLGKIEQTNNQSRNFAGGMP